MPFLDSSQPAGLLSACNLIHVLVRDEFSGGTWRRGKVTGLKRLPRHKVWHRSSGSLLFVPAAYMHTAWKPEMESFFVRWSKDVCQQITVAVFLTAASGYCSTSAVMKLLTASAPQWHLNMSSKCIKAKYITSGEKGQLSTLEKTNLGTLNHCKCCKFSCTSELFHCDPNWASVFREKKPQTTKHPQSYTTFVGWVVVICLGQEQSLLVMEQLTGYYYSFPFCFFFFY